MNQSDRRRLTLTKLSPALIVAVVLGMSLILGLVANIYLLFVLVAIAGGIILLLQPELGLLVLVVAALLAKFEVPTGTEVMLNPTTLLVPALAGAYLLAAMQRRSVAPANSSVLVLMAAFLLIGVISLLVGNATWDPFVPRNSNFWLVQLAQWALIAFSFVAYWLSASLGKDVRWLKVMTAGFLAIGGLLALLISLPPTSALASSIGTLTLIRAPFWFMLVALAGGQLLFNNDLKSWQKITAGAIVAVVIIYSFVIGREAASNWVGVGSALAVLVWFRYRRLRWIALLFAILLLLTGVIVPTIWDFAGGEAEWAGSGRPRLLLIERVLSVSMRNPVTGLGPVAYRNYASTTPLVYRRAFWELPQINSHNNYVDIFAQFGLVGLALFGWLAVAIGRLGIRLVKVYREGFEAAYVRAVMAAGAGALAVMILADWILPFVYNIGFPGFQASVLFWLFLGGLTALGDNAGASELHPEGDGVLDS